MKDLTKYKYDIIVRLFNLIFVDIITKTDFVRTKLESLLYVTQNA